MVEFESKQAKVYD